MFNLSSGWTQSSNFLAKLKEARWAFIALGGGLESPDECRKNLRKIHEYEVLRELRPSIGLQLYFC